MCVVSLTSPPPPITPEERSPATLWIGGSVCLVSSLDVAERRNIFVRFEVLPAVCSGKSFCLLEVTWRFGRHYWYHLRCCSVSQSSMLYFYPTAYFSIPDKYPSLVRKSSHYSDWTILASCTRSVCSYNNLNGVTESVAIWGHSVVQPCSWHGMWHYNTSAQLFAAHIFTLKKCIFF